MLRFEYTPLGYAMSDFEIDDYIKNLSEVEYIEEIQNWSAKFSTSLIFSRIRLLIAQDILPHDQVRFVFEGKDIIINEYGAIVDWPNGFCDSDIKTASEILKCAIDKKRKKRNDRNADITTN